MANHLPFSISQNGRNLDCTDRYTGKGIRYTLPAVGVTISGNTLSFDWNGGHWVYTVTGTGLKLSATFPTPRGPQHFSQPYALLGGAGAVTVLADGSVQGDGFRLPAPYVTGADGVVYKIGAWTAGPTSLDFDWDDSALSPSSYPYSLDPSTTFSAAASGDDGLVGRDNVGDTTYPPAGVTTVDTAGTFLASARELQVDGHFDIYAALVGWDTSSILDDAATVYAVASMTMFSHGVTDGPRNATVEWYDYGASIDAADYTATASGSANTGIDLASLPADGSTVDFALSSPETNINKAGFTKLRFHVDGPQPTGANNFANYASFDHATLTEPRLIVTYTRYGPPAHSGIDESATGTSAAPAITLANTPAGGDFLTFFVSGAGTTATAITTADTRLTAAPTGTFGGSGASTREGRLFWGFWQSGGSLTFTFAATNAAWIVEKVAYSGIDDVNTLLVENGAANASGTSVTPAVTPGTGLRAAIVCAISNKSAATWSAETIGGSATGVTERRDVVNTTLYSAVMFDRIDTSTPAGTVSGAATPTAAAIGTGHIAIFRGLGPAPSAPFPPWRWRRFKKPR